MILFQTAKGDPAICVKPSLCITSHTAAKTPFSVAALSSGFSAPCSGSRIYTPYILIGVLVSGFQLFHQTAFRVCPISEQSFVTHIVAEYGQDQGIFPILAE